MTALATTSYVRPTAVVDALEHRASHPEWVVLAGGTDTMVPGTRARRATGVIDVFAVDELHGVEATFETIRIGACTTYAELLASGALHATLPLLAAAAREIGAEQIRQRGTIGGNVVTCSPVGDLLPGLLALDASVVIASAHGSRTVEYEQFVLGYRQVDLTGDELLIAVEIPRPEPGTVQHWRKVGTRAAQSIAKLSFAATARVTEGRARHVRLAFGGVADHPIRLHAVEPIVEGAVVESAVAAAVRAAVVEAVHPISDGRSTADYRRDVAASLAARFVAGLAS